MEGRLTHGDLVLEGQVGFLAVVEHRLIPAGVRSEWARLRSKGLATVSSCVGHAGVGVISMKGAPVSLPSFATAQFRRFFDCGCVGASFLSVLAGLCTWWCYMVTKVLILVLSSLL